MGALDLSVELRRPRLDVDMLHAQIGDMPVEQRLELVAAIRSDGANVDRKKKLRFQRGPIIGIPLS
jgi:hypothetical protein